MTDGFFTVLLIANCKAVRFLLDSKNIRFYGLDDTREFIKRFLENPSLRNRAEHGQSFFDLYMS